MKIYKFSEGVFYIHTAGYGIYINGIPANSGASFSSIDTVQRLNREHKRVITLDGVEITSSKLNELESEFFTYVDGDDEDREKEFLYKGAKDEYEIFLERVSHNFIVNESFSDIEYVIIESPDIPSEYIKYLLPRELDGIESFGMVQLKIEEFAKDTFIYECEKHSLAYEIPSHSCLRFAKISEEYACNDSFGWKNSGYPLPLIEAIAKLKSVRKAIVDVVRVYALRGTKLDQADALAVFKFLDKLKGSIVSLNVKVESLDKKRSLLGMVNEFTTQIKSTYITQMDG